MITIEKFLILKDVPLFRFTPDEGLVELAYNVREELVEANGVIIKQGEIGDTMYVVVKGRVAIYSGDKLVHEVPERDTFGEYSALSPAPRNATAKAMEDSLLLAIDRATLYRLMSFHKGLVKGIIEVLCQRLRAGQPVNNE